MAPKHEDPRLWIAGLGSQYPPFIAGPEKFDTFAKSVYGTENPGINQLLKINKATGIDNRATVKSFDSGFGKAAAAPTIAEIGELWRHNGVNLTVQACKKALREWGGDYQDLTHTISVTCTDATTPGYDLLVAQKLGLSRDIKKMLLAGIGCAGGMTTMRVAAEIACGATARNLPARILCFACELCTLNVRCNLDETSRTNPTDVSVAGALFSDGASAFVLCNDLGIDDPEEAVYQILEWGNTTIPNTAEYMGFSPMPDGFRTILTGDVVSHTNNAMKPMYQRLLPAIKEKEGEHLIDADFDWALHPEGATIITGVQEQMKLSNEQLRATREIYRTRGNSSSPTTVIVLDKLRTMGKGKDYVVAAAVGPGLNIEMTVLKRVRGVDSSDDEGGF